MTQGEVRAERPLYVPNVPKVLCISRMCVPQSRTRMRARDLLTPRRRAAESRLLRDVLVVDAAKPLPKPRLSWCVRACVNATVLAHTESLADTARAPTQVQPLRLHLDSQRLVRRGPRRRHALLFWRRPQVHALADRRRPRAQAAWATSTLRCWASTACNKATPRTRTARAVSCFTTRAPRASFPGTAS